MGQFDLFLFAGEQSGDLHGAALLQALKQQRPSLKVCGVGGPALRALDIHTCLWAEDFQVMGFSAVIKALPKLYKNFYCVRDFILDTQPEAVVLIDYPGFNLRLAKSLRAKGFKKKLIHYIAPTVWAWKKGRIAEMASTLDMLLTIYPFEPACFAHTNLSVPYVGNPLVAALQRYPYYADWRERAGFGDEDYIALFPGSRREEVQRNLPLQLGALKNFNHRYAISCAHPSLERLIRKFAGDDALVVPGELSYDLMRHARAAIAKSGTVTLELALHGCPTAVTYEISYFNYAVAKHLLRINLPHYCIANILLNETLFPEMIGSGLDPLQLSQNLRTLLEPESLMRTSEAAMRLRTLLGEEDANQKAAQLVGNLLA